MKHQYFALLTSALVALPLSAQTYTSSGAFLGAVGSPFYTETFETVPVAKDVAQASFSQMGITYTGLAGSPSANVFVSSPGYTNFGVGLNPTTSSILTANGDEDFNITFANPFYAVGFGVYYNGPGPATASFFNGNTQLGSIVYNGAAFLGFNGYISETSDLITSVHFVSTAGGQLNTGIDDLAVFNTPSLVTPEPASLALLSVGVVVIGIARRKRSGNRRANIR